VMLQQLHASQHVAATARILAREVELEGTWVQLYQESIVFSYIKEKSD
jgi:hypothetical protein